MNKGKCLTETDEFTKPKRGQIVAEIDEFPLEHEFSITFDIMIKSAQKDYTNILFATDASPETLVDADFDDLLNPRGDVSIGKPFPAINRRPAMWIMPGNASDEQVGFMICGEYFKWNEDWGDELGFPEITFSFNFRSLGNFYTGYSIMSIFSGKLLP